MSFPFTQHIISILTSTSTLSKRISPSLLGCALEMCGDVMLKKFKRQFKKMLAYISEVYLPTCHKLI